MMPTVKGVILILLLAVLMGVFSGLVAGGYSWATFCVGALFGWFLVSDSLWRA